MNAQAPIYRREPLKLSSSAFWLLKSDGAFSAFSKSELLEGEISGVPVDSESDSSVPIRLRVQDYHRLDAADIFQGHSKTELIDGAIYPMSPQHRPHGYIKDELAYRLRRVLEDLGRGLHVATEQSVAIEPYSEPQPDIILTTEPRGIGAIPVSSVALLVEVAASTLSFDLNDKAAIYAAAGIAEYWVVDVNRSVIHQLWSPQGESYAERREVAFGAPLVAVSIAGLTLDTGGLEVIALRRDDGTLPT